MKHFTNLLRGYGLALLSAALLFSCSQVDTFESADLSEAQERIALTFKNPNGLENSKVKDGVNDCARHDVKLNVGNGKFMDLGEVSVYKDAAKLYVTINIHDNDSPWFIAKSSLFIGKVSSLGKRNPAPGQFPHSADISSLNNTGDKEYTYEFDLKDFTGKSILDFSIHADVIRVETNPDGSIAYVNGMATIVQKEGAWGDGQRFNDKGNWATYFQYDVDQECGACDPVWTSLTGALVYNEAGDNNQFFDEDIEFDFLGEDGEVVGKATVRLQDNGNIHVRYTTMAGYLLEEVSWIYSTSPINSIADRSVFDENKVVFDPFINDTDFLKVGEEGNRTSKPAIYFGFYAKVNGACE